MEFRIYTESPDFYKDSGVKVFKEIGLKWFANIEMGFVPKNPLNDAPEDMQLKFRSHFKFKQWCEANCKANVACLVNSQTSAPIFYFASEEDATLFKLTWC